MEEESKARSRTVKIDSTQKALVCFGAGGEMGVCVYMQESNEEGLELSCIHNGRRLRPAKQGGSLDMFICRMCFVSP